VCAGDGHTEALEVTFNPAVVSYEELIELFFKSHPSQYQQQRQYQSALYPVSQEQAEQANLALAEKKPLGSKTLVESPAQEFWAAEWYHQNHNQKQQLQLALLALFLLSGAVPAGTFGDSLQTARQGLGACLYLSAAPQILESIWGVVKNVLFKRQPETKLAEPSESAP